MIKLTKKLLFDAYDAMQIDFLVRADRAARKLCLPTRAQAHARTPAGRAQARAAVQRARAVLIGENYHTNVAPLHASARGAVSYGAGGLEHVEYLYAKSYRYPAIWRDGGARIEGRTLILEDYKKRERARFLMPPARAALAPVECLLDGDVYAILDGDGGAVRYGVAGRTGYALLHGAVWEHGANAEHCRAEGARKAALVVLQAQAATESARDARRLRLLAKISTKIIVTRNDARAAGACTAGIDAFCNRHGLGTGAPARDVVALASQTGERRALAAALMACRRAIA